MTQTIEQLQAKVAELEADIEFQTNARIQDRKDAETNYKNWNAELKKQLSAAQEEIERYKASPTVETCRQMIESQAVKENKILFDQLAKAERRVAELEAALKVAREALANCAADYLHADSVLTDSALAKINEVLK